jgi:DNA polymerase III epsilon subunit-like protein
MLDLSVRRVMIDLETMSAQRDAAIISLGAVQFGHGVSPDSAVHFYQNVIHKIQSVGVCMWIRAQWNGGINKIQDFVQKHSQVLNP